jgi:hypothetical protein
MALLLTQGLPDDAEWLVCCACDQYHLRHGCKAQEVTQEKTQMLAKVVVFVH